MAKAVCSPWKTRVATSNQSEKHSASFIFSLQQKCGQDFELSKRNRLLATACWEDIRQYSFTYQGNHRYGSQHLQNTFPRHLHSLKNAVCPRCVFYVAWKLQGKLNLWAWILGPDGKSSIFSLWKLQTCSLKPSKKKKKKHYVSFISSLHKKFDQAFFFLNNKQLSSLAKSL